MYDDLILDYRYFEGRSEFVIHEHEFSNRIFPWCVAVSVMEGEYFVDFEDGEEICVKSGEIIIIQSFVKHTVRMEAQGKLTFVHFLCRYANIDIFALADIRYFVARGDKLHELLNRLNIKIYNNKIAQKIYIHGVMCELVLHLFDMNYLDCQVFKIEPWLNTVLQYINTHLREGILVDELIDKSGYSKTMFYRMFKNAMKVSPREYIEAERFNCVLLLLLKNTKIKDVAHSIGFTDVSYFNKVFKRIYGLTPTEYRQNMIDLRSQNDETD